MVKTRKFSLIAAALVLMTLLLPLFSLNVRAAESSEIILDTTGPHEILELAQSRGERYKAALIDADFYNSENGCLANAQENLLLNELQKMAEKIYCNIGIIIVHDLKGSTPEYIIEQFKAREFSRSDSPDCAIYLFMNVHDNEEYISKVYSDNMLFEGYAKNLYSNKGAKIYKHVQDGLNGSGKGNPYFTASMNFGRALVKLYNDPDADLDAPEKDPDTENPAESKPQTPIQTPTESYDPFDSVKTERHVFKAALLETDFFSSEDGCLTSQQEAELLELMSETADKIKCNVGIIITNESWGKSDTSLVREFHQKMFGEYSDSITLLMFNSHGASKYSSFQDQIYYTDRGYDLFNRRLDDIYDRLYVPIDKDPDDLFGACKSFCAAITWFGSGFGEFLTRFNVSGTSIFMSAVLGVIVSLIAVKIITKGYKKKTPISASHYIDTHRTRINRQVDQFVREYTTSVRIQSSSGGGHHGGGGGHRSGGGGGRHR